MKIDMNLIQTSTAHAKARVRGCEDSLGMGFARRA